MKKIFVTGGGGFIGSHLVERLVKDGYKVKTLVQYNVNNDHGWLEHIDKKFKNKLQIVIGDINDSSFILKETKNFDIILHLAALISIPYSYNSPASYIHTNIIGTLNCLEAVRVNKIKKIVHTSTSEVYGSAKFIPMSEEHPINPQSPYAASKISADHLCFSYHKSFNLPVSILRPFNTFGPRQSLRAAIPSIITQYLRNKNHIEVGNTYARRDFTFVEDTVDGFIKCMNSKKSIGQVINLGTGYDVSIQEIIDNVSIILKKKLKIKKIKNRVRPKKSEVDRLLSNNVKAKVKLNWRPKFKGKKGFRIALVKTIEWFKKEKNLDLYNSNRYNI